MRIAGYEFAPSARIPAGAKADVVGRHLDMLRQKCKGELTPQDVLADAMHNNSPLHGFFEWSDTKAAQEYRLQQARGLIRCVVAIYTAPDTPAKRLKAFVHIDEPGAPHYRSTIHAMSRKKTREMVLRQAWREFTAWRKRYEDLKEFGDLFEVADAVAKKLPKPVRAH